MNPFVGIRRPKLPARDILPVAIIMVSRISPANGKTRDDESIASSLMVQQATLNRAGASSSAPVVRRGDERDTDDALPARDILPVAIIMVKRMYPPPSIPRRGGGGGVGGVGGVAGIGGDGGGGFEDCQHHNLNLKIL